MSTKTVRPLCSVAAYHFACELTEVQLCSHTVDDPQTSEAIQHLLKQLQLVDTDAPMESLRASMHKSLHVLHEDLYLLSWCSSTLQSSNHVLQP